MTLMSAPRMEAPHVLSESGIMLPAGFYDRDAVGGGGGANSIQGTVVINDDFVEVSTLDLDLHTPLTGGAWTRTALYCSNGTIKLECADASAGYATLSFSNASAVYHQPTSGSADLDIVMSVTNSANASADSVLWFRMDPTTAQNGYLLACGAGTLRFYEWTTGGGLNIRSDI